MSVDESVIPTVEELRVINPKVRFHVRATSVCGTPGLTIQLTDNLPALSTAIVNDPPPLMIPVGDTIADLHVINPMIRFQVRLINAEGRQDCGFFNRAIPIHFSTRALPDEDDIVHAVCACMGACE